MDAWDLRDDFSAAEVATVIDSQETCGQEVEFQEPSPDSQGLGFHSIAASQTSYDSLDASLWKPNLAGAKRSLPTLAPPVDPVTPLRSP